MNHGILMHEADDDVGVTVMDLDSGSEVEAVTLDGQPVATIKVTEDVPLSHKIAIREIPEGKKVVEYGRPIGKATQPIPRGSHVHVHNLKSLRW
jgi:(2R)-sulfolactate sulfo-lyase subunit alpha